MLPPVRTQAPFLYKYRSFDHPEWLESIVLKNELYFPTPRELNDPAEARPKLIKPPLDALIATIADRSGMQKPHLNTRGQARETAILALNAPRFGVDAIMRDFTPSLHRTLEGFRIYSLSKRWDNPRLWKEYGANYRGYCLEFRNEAYFGPAFDVRYRNEISLDITDPEIGLQFLFYKTRKWRKEEEVRMINRLNSAAIIAFDPRFLTRIIIGRNTRPEHEALIRAIADRRERKLPVVSERCAARFPMA
jgi:hypothetical protein